MCEWCSTFIFLLLIDTVNTNRPPQNRGLNLWLERVESPGSRRTAVLQGRVESRCPTRYLERKKRGDTLVTGYVAGDGGVTGISAHSSPTGLRGVTLSETSRFHRYFEHLSKQRGCSSRRWNRLDLGVSERKPRPISLSLSHTHIHYYIRAPRENPTNLDNDSCGCVVLARWFLGGRKYLVHSRKYGKRTPNG